MSTENEQHSPRALRTAAKIVAVGALCLPGAAYAATYAETSTEVAYFDIDAHITRDQRITVKVGGLVPEISLPAEGYGPLGVEIEVGGITKANPSAENLLAAGVAVYDNPGAFLKPIKYDLIQDGLKKGIAAEAGLMACAGLFLTRRRWIKPEVLDKISNPAVAGPVALATAIALTPAVSAHLDPPETQAAYAVTAAKGTPFEGMTTNGRFSLKMINQTLATYKTIAGRQRKGREEWTRNFEASLLAKTGTLPQPRHDELQFYAISDEHCNLASIDALAKLADSEKPDGIFTLGDNTDGGTTYEQFCIDKLAALKGSGETERPFGGVTGNHDSDEIINARRKLGIPTLTGETVKFGELTITGDRDPEQNRPFTSVLYPVNGKDQETAGRELAEKTHGKNVDAALVHEPRMGQAYTAHMDPRTRLVLWGHTHKSTPPTVIRHRDGTWTVQKQLGSAGGTHIPGASSSLSLPWDKPTGPVVFSVIYMNKDTKLVTGMRDVQISTEGTLAYEKRQSFVAPKNTMVKPHI